MEPDRKKARTEPQQSLEATANTTYVRCKHMNSRWDLVNEFFREHRIALGLSEFFAPRVRSEEHGIAGENDASPAPSSTNADSELVMTKAPVNAVFSAASRKPYFLVEFTGPSAASLTKRLRELPQPLRTFRGMPVEIAAAAEGQTVAALRAKLEDSKKPTSSNGNGAKSVVISSPGEAEKPSQPTPNEEETSRAQPAATALSFVPRVVAMRKR